MKIELSNRELGTVLAALRYWQHNLGFSAPLDDIATNGGAFTALDAAEIDELCERINCS